MNSDLNNNYRKWSINIISIYSFLNVIYLSAILFLPRIGDHLKISEFIFPFLFLFTLYYLRDVKKLFGIRILIAISVFFFIILISNLMAFLFIKVDIIYLIALPVRYVEIITVLFSTSICAFHRPRFFLKSIKIIFILLSIYILLNIAFNLRRGYYGLAVIPGETGPAIVGVVFGLFSIFFLWIYLAKKYLNGSHEITGNVARMSLSLFFISIFFVLINVQRTTIISTFVTVLFAIIISMALKHKKLLYQNVKITALLIVAGGISAIAVGYFAGEIIETLFRIVERFGTAERAANTRYENWLKYFSDDSWSGVTSFFGVGLGAHNYFSGSGGFNLHFDSLPLRLLYETGIIGLISFFIFHIMIVARVYSRGKIVGLLAVLLLIFMIGLGITFEAPFVYVPGSVFYAFMGLSIGLSFNMITDSKNRHHPKRKGKFYIKTSSSSL